MFTRRAALKQFLAEESEDSHSSTRGSVEADSEETYSESTQPISKKTIISNPSMEEADAALAAPLRKRLDRLQGKMTRCRDKLSRQRDQDIPASSDYELLQETQSMLESTHKEQEKLSTELYEVENNPTAIAKDEHRADEFEEIITAATRDCRYLLSQRSVYSNIQSLETNIRGLTAAYDMSPENDHTTIINRLLQTAKSLEHDLHFSLMSEEEELRGRGTALLEKAYALQGRVAGAKPSDVKPLTSASTSKSNVKLKHIEIPSFSGKTEDWLAFKRLFYKAVHLNESLYDDTRLTYLVQAMQDSRVKAEYAERLDETGAYQNILKELDEEHDKPRWMHHRYCEALKNLSTNRHTREGMKNLISQVTVILNGFIRLKGENCRYILTSMTEAVLDPQLRALWNQRTDTKKTTPPIEDLLQFIKDQSDQMEDDSMASTSKQQQQLQHERKVRGHQPSRYKGSAHSVVSPLPNTSMKGSQPKQSYQQYVRPSPPNNVSPCPLCQGGHHLFYCPTFEGCTVAQRKDHVMGLKLCLNCLKPNHVAQECRSAYRCKAKDCGKKHNSLLHEERVSAPIVQPATHQINAATHSDSEEEEEDCLLMTSQVTLVGPTGKMLTVRGLLDGGSTLSLVSNRVMKLLSLEKTGKTVSISCIKSKNSKQAHPMAKVTIKSNYTQGWSREITVAGLDEVIRQLPL